MVRKINKMRLIRFLEVLAIAEPAYINEMVRGVHYAWRLLYYSGILLLLLEIYQTGISKRFKDILLPVLIYSVIFVSTVVQKGVVKDSALRLLTYSYCLTLVLVCNQKKQMIDLLRIIRNILFILVAINFFSVLAFPNGLYQRVKSDYSIDSRYWFLGFKNGLGKNGVILCAVSFTCCFIRPNHINDLIAKLAVLFSAGTTLLIGSGSGILGTVIVVAICYWMKSRHINRFKLQGMLCIRNLALFVAVLFLIVVISNYLLTNELVQRFIIQTLGKTVTLTGRTPIWNSVIKIIRQNWLLGIGLQPTEQVVEMIGIGPHATDAHDYYLEFFLEGGVICFSLLALFLWKVVNRLNQNSRSIITAGLSAGLFSLLFIFLVENCNNAFLWLFFGLCLCCKEIIRESEKKIVDRVIA